MQNTHAVNATPLRKKNTRREWRRLFNLTVLSAYFYAAMEWVFFATKPSSLSVLSLFDSLKVLVVTGGTIALAAIALLLLLSLPAWLVSRADRRARLLAVGHVVPALLLAITALIMLDNFTYTVLKFGIVSTEGIVRGSYALAFLVFFGWMFLSARQAAWARRRAAFYLSLSLLAISTVGILTTRLSNLDSYRLESQSPDSSASYPNIIILGSDGLTARYLSMYGAQEDTTPFLTELARTSLVAENAFPNASHTTASTTSVLTGKEPIRTKVFRFPDILAGKDSFQHLPGILKQHGYKTVEIGYQYYVDARRLNLLEGFDIVNNHALNSPSTEALRTVLGNSPSAYFVQTISERAAERLLHIFSIADMPDALAEVNEPAVRISDQQRVDQIIDHLARADRPVFIFAHLIDTHGPKFAFQKQVFSDESSVEKPWDERRYMDSILSFDDHVKEIYDYLVETGTLDDTVLVIYSDHGLEYAFRDRIPLLIHFPENAYAGRRQNNVQNLDIPVTLIDYLGLPRPAWMTGTSLLDGEPPLDREIISTNSGSPEEIAPPFYQINIVQMIVCNKWYALNVRKNTFARGAVRGHTLKCGKDLLPSDAAARQRLLELLEQEGYDTSSLR